MAVPKSNPIHTRFDFFCACLCLYSRNYASRSQKDHFRLRDRPRCCGQLKRCLHRYNFFSYPKWLSNCVILHISCLSSFFSYFESSRAQKPLKSYEQPPFGNLAIVASIWCVRKDKIFCFHGGSRFDWTLSLASRRKSDLHKEVADHETARSTQLLLYELGRRCCFVPQLSHRNPCRRNQ